MHALAASAIINSTRPSTTHLSIKMIKVPGAFKAARASAGLPVPARGANPRLAVMHPTHRADRACRLNLPVLPQVLAAAIGSETQQQAARQGDLALVRVDHRGPPLHRHAITGDDGPAHADGDLPLGAGAALPVLADRVAAQERLAEDAGPVGGIRHK